MNQLERYRPYIDDWTAFIDACNRPLPTTIWANPLKTSAEDLEAQMRRTGVRFRPVEWRDATYRLDGDESPGTRFEFMAGLYQVQEEAAMPAADLLAPESSDRVLDLCAAPGNKTAQLAVAMGGQGMVVANDKNYGRLRAVRALLDRLGLFNVAVTNHDALRMPDLGTFDRVMADVPCSCEGTLRKNPTALELAAATNLRELGGVQAAMLRKGIEACKPGGTIIYATCTFAPEENEAVVSRTLREFGDSVSLVPCGVEGFQHAPGILEFEGETYDPRVEQCMRVWPHHNDTGGFFVAAFRRQA